MCRQDVRVRQIELRRLRLLEHRRQLETPAALGVEQGREDGRAIEIWPAHEVDRAVERDQRRGLEIADDPMLLDAAARNRVAKQRRDRGLLALSHSR